MKPTVAEAQAKRLAKGCCPVHGLFMTQISEWQDTDTDSPFSWVGCPRKDCSIAAKTRGYGEAAFDVCHDHREIVDRSALHYWLFCRATDPGIYRYVVKGLERKAKKNPDAAASLARLRRAEAILHGSK